MINRKTLNRKRINKAADRVLGPQPKSAKLVNKERNYYAGQTGTFNRYNNGVIIEQFKDGYWKDETVKVKSSLNRKGKKRIDRDQYDNYGDNILDKFERNRFEDAKEKNILKQAKDKYTKNPDRVDIMQYGIKNRKIDKEWKRAGYGKYSSAKSKWNKRA